MDLLKDAGSEVAYYDPYVPVIKHSHKHPHWAGTESVVWNESIVSNFDAALIATAHVNVNYVELVGWQSRHRHTQRNAQTIHKPKSRTRLTH